MIDHLNKQNFMENRELALSAQGISNIASSILQSDFEFRIGTEKYKTSSVLADFISPIIAQQHLSDPNIDHFDIDIIDGDKNFEEIMKLIVGQTINITDENKEFLRLVATKLGNSEMIEAVFFDDNEDFNTITICGLTQKRADLNLPIVSEVEYIARHIWEIEQSNIAKLDPFVLGDVLKSKSLQVENEGWLLRFIIKQIQEQGNAYRFLLRYVLCENLNDSELAEYLQALDFDDVNGEVWDSICRRLTLSSSETNTSVQSRYHTGSPTYKPYKEYPFDGILAYLNSLSGGNANEKNVVKITSSSVINSSMSCPSNILNYDSNDYFHSKTAENSWISLDFKQKRVLLSHYTLKSYEGQVNDSHLKSWVIEGSNDGVNWTELDRREDNNELNGKFKAKTFKCQRIMESRRIRLRQIGKNHAGNDILTLCGLELFGTLITRI